MKACVGSQSGISERTGNAWQTDEYLIVVPGQYERKIKVEVRGAERCEQWKKFFDGMSDKNQPVVVKFEIDANEYQGKWFNRVEAWDISMSQW